MLLQPCRHTSRQADGQAGRQTHGRTGCIYSLFAYAPHSKPRGQLRPGGETPPETCCVLLCGINIPQVRVFTVWFLHTPTCRISSGESFSLLLLEGCLTARLRGLMNTSCCTTTTNITVRTFAHRTMFYTITYLINCGRQLPLAPALMLVFTSHWRAPAS